MKRAVALPEERSVAQFGGTQIPYTIRRSGHRATVSIAIEAGAGVLVTAPTTAAVARLDDLVRTKALWILERLRRKSELPAQSPLRDLVSGTTFRYLGRQYRLQLDRGADSGLPGLHGARLVLSVPPGLTSMGETQYIRSALVDWFRKRAAEYLPAKVDKLAPRVGVAAGRVVITEPPKRWGSAAKDGTLRLNWRIVQAPIALVDYVVLHELVHLIHSDHGREFWAKLWARSAGL